LKREVDNFHSRRWNLRKSLPLLLVGTVYALFGSIVWSAHQGTERRPPLEARLVERAADSGRPGGIGDRAPVARSIFPADEVLRRAIRPFRDPLRTLLEPGGPLSPSEEVERAMLLATARTQDGALAQAPSGSPPDQPAPERTMVEAPDAPPGSPADDGTAAVLTATPASEAEQAPEPDPVTGWPPKPSFKPLHATAAASAQTTAALIPEVLDAEDAPGAAAPEPPRPAFKPSFVRTDLAEIAARGPPPRDRSERRDSPTVLGAFWSGLKALFASASRPVLLAGGDGGGDLRAGRNNARAGDRNGPAGIGDDGGGTSGSDRGGDRGDSGRGGDRGDGGRGGDRGDGGRGGDRGGDRGDGGRGSDRGDAGRGGEGGGGRGRD
jgi:hypothetical protein